MQPASIARGHLRTLPATSSRHLAQTRHLRIPPRSAYQYRSVTIRPSASAYTGFMGDNIVNFYSGQPPLNRLSFHRNETTKMDKHLNASEAKFLLFKDGKPLMSMQTSGETKDKTPTGLLYLSQSSITPYLPSKSFAECPNPEDKDVAKQYQSARLPTTLPALVFLGIDDRTEAKEGAVPAEVNPKDPKGVPYFALDVSGANVGGGNVDLGELGAGEAEFVEPRLAGSSLGGWEANLFAQARALMDWNTRYKFCPGCGSPTYSLWCGWKRGCGSVVGEGRDGYGGEGGKVCPSTKGLHNYAYPRTDPVIIMGILDPTGKKMLMGRQKAWPKGMYSCLAGFIEPGESIEDAVRREVMEEAGVKVGQVRYSSCQPWPFPANLMIGCYGLVASDAGSIDLELDNELEDARWFTQDSVLDILNHPEGTNITRSEHKKFEPKQVNTASGVQEGAALAPAEGQTEESALENARTEGPPPSFRFPPKTAIAGVLIDRWARGQMDEVAIESVKNKL
ncbi:hypothetical protein FFLO_06400 [Filobasidium floriforme]|uniref:NAD(+) diphosphatase n=1 Tax=Filobasidium floriforme TaxID=5210 RepID=A0A8K0JF03_9TREE|nr:NUDIX hydrolase domain-like protein [Filobasidium floriforme]KAG7528108.1 hypothetical protein FFLO_06400 [Filobasidium floriforme]KAH8082781.1 NUDIX hydrolase domain-like protein [Filobasidium floriforme]